MNKENGIKKNQLSSVIPGEHQKAKQYCAYKQKASEYLNTLCNVKPNRRTGSAGNRQATDFFSGAVRHWGYSIDTTLFSCLDFESGQASLICENNKYTVFPSPFSLGCDIKAELVTVSNSDELKLCKCKGKILLMHGPICAEQLMPKNFVFYNPDHHKQIYSLLEEKQPAAIITATAKNPELVGGEYPFPMFEDGDFHIPSVYCKDTTGIAIAQKKGSVFTLVSGARRIPSHACNVIARKNPGSKKKIVVCAHIDARANTPGATDNASGVVILLLLAEMIAQETCTSGVELIAFNGEDYYNTGGEMDYLKRYEHELDTITVAVNLDGIGFHKGKTIFSLYECTDLIREKAYEVFGRYKGIMEGDPFYQGDHMVFIQKGVPAVTFTSENMREMLSAITHTPNDIPGIVDCGKLVETAYALKEFVLKVF